MVGSPHGRCAADHRTASPRGRAQCAMVMRVPNGACVMAVGRDVPIAPHRPVAVGNVRAPWRVCNGGAIMTSRRVRGPAAHRAADRAAACKTLSVCYLPSRAPRRWRGGAMGTSRPTAKPHERCARPRGTGGAHRRRNARANFAWANGGVMRRRVMRGRNGHRAHAESFAGGVSVRPL